LFLPFIICPFVDLSVFIFSSYIPAFLPFPIFSSCFPCLFACYYSLTFCLFLFISYVFFFSIFLLLPNFLSIRLSFCVSIFYIRLPQHYFCFLLSFFHSLFSPYFSCFCL
jgi:hypothetical protein